MQYKEREPYTHVIGIFLLFDPKKGFLFEKRTNPVDLLYGKIVIPGGKANNPGERSFPLWVAQRECLEEVGIVLQSVMRLNSLYDPQQNNWLCPFLMTGKILWGKIENLEPEKKDLVWLPLDQIFHESCGRVTTRPLIKVETTRKILLDGKYNLEKFNLLPKTGL